MKAIVQDTYGSADVLKLEDIDTPVIGDDDALVRVHAAGVDQGVWHLMTGLPYMVRLLGFGLRAPKVRVPGMDVAGRVEAVGAKVKHLQPGDEVFGTGEGTFAEYTRASAELLAPKPAGLTFEQAAAVPTSACTALQGLRDEGRVEPGQKVLVIGASGGVGTYAVQIATALGASVTGVCSTAKLEMVRSIGADHVFDYTREDFARSDQQFDVILDIGGNRSLSDLRGVLTDRGTLVIVGGEEGGRWIGGTDRLLRAALLSPLVRQRLRVFVSTARRDDLRFLTELIDDGRVAPVIDRTFPLSEAPDAIRYLKAGSARGKIVVTV